MELDLYDKVVLVTGSTRGLGFAIANAFLAEGAKVAISGRHKASLLHALKQLGEHTTPESIFGFTGDLSRPDGIRQCVKQVLRRFGRLDVLVANVGTGQGDTGWDAPEKLWDDLYRENLTGGVRIARALIPTLKRSKNASIVFVSSIAGRERVGGPLAYGSAKAALNQFSKALADQLATDGIRVNTVAPGNILARGGSWEKKLRTKPAAVRRYIQQAVPMQRLARPEEIADVVTFVASPRASFMTGSCVVVDGGQSRSL